MRPDDLIQFKRVGKPITILTAWDSLSSSLVEESGADVVLVGDSLAMVSMGHSTTLPVTVEEMLFHTKAVCRGFSKPLQNQPLVVTDLPFLSYQCGEDKAVEAAGKIIKESCASAVKLEGAEPEVISVISRLVRMGIPVMGHIGLTPQSVHKTGYKRQAEDPISQEQVYRQALTLENAGCFSLVIEHVPDSVAKRIKASLKIPLIGIGAGQNLDGQVRVTADLLGLTKNQPPFSKNLIPGRKLFIDALQTWVDQQRQEVKIPTTKQTPQKPDC